MYVLKRTMNSFRRDDNYNTIILYNENMANNFAKRATLGFGKQ